MYEIYAYGDNDALFGIFNAGRIAFQHGDFIGGRDQLEESIRLHGDELRDIHLVQYAQDAKASALGWLAMALWVLGYQTTPKEKNFHGLGYIVHGQVRVHWAPSPMHVDWMRYLGHHGSLVIHIRKPPCGTKFHLISGYSHVWRSSRVTGFSISTGGFGISWSDETHAWETDSYTGVYRRAC